MDTLAAVQCEVFEIEVGRLAVTGRGVTTLRAAQLLLEEAHWKQPLLLRASSSRGYSTLKTSPRRTTPRPLGRIAGRSASWHWRGCQRQLSYAASLGYQDASGTLDALDKFLAPGNLDEFRDRKIVS